MTTLLIKNMVCDRCIMVVRQMLEQSGCHIISVTLGQAVIEETLTTTETERISQALAAVGFELLHDKATQTVEAIKNEIVRLVYANDAHLKTKLSAHLAQLLKSDYSALSKLFSEQTGLTIEKYFITQKIERVKEMLSYSEYTLNEIAVKMDYSSIAYLSAQFKTVTGLTPTQYKNAKNQTRKPIDKL